MLHISDLISHHNSGEKKGLPVTRASEPSVSLHKEDGIMIRESNQWVIPVKEPQGGGNPYHDLR
jgi:hypothetical protein